MSRTISVQSAGPSKFRVTVNDNGTRTVHEVTAIRRDVERYAPGVSPARLLKASFEFLLEREPQEAILERFELPAIERFFPEYARQIGDLL